MEILLTLPSHFASYIRKHRKDYPGITAVFSDPDENKLGSGGGTVNALWEHYVNSEKTKRRKSEKKSCSLSFSEWLRSDKRIIIHSDGQSRRLPAYAPVGKSFIPFPVFKWGRGQHIRQTLFNVQKPLLEKILNKAPRSMNTLIASGDALVYCDTLIPEIPESDVVCIGIWAQPGVVSSHGIFVCPRHDPTNLEFMLQKPSIDTIQSLTSDYLFLLDAGIWILSDNAVEILLRNTGWNKKKSSFIVGIPKPYDLYSGFGETLGRTPDVSKISVAKDPRSPSGIRRLESRILPLPTGEFYHFGSNSDLIKSTSAMHNRVIDQREIWHKKIKPSPDIFVQNSITRITLTPRHRNLWIDNSCIPETWKLAERHILTGIPGNTWNIELPAGICLDLTPIGTNRWCIRSYGYEDDFKGKLFEPSATWMNKPAMEWFSQRGISNQEIKEIISKDIYQAELFPVLDKKDLDEDFVQWMTGESIPSRNATAAKFKKIWLVNQRLSCADLIKLVNHERVFRQTDENLKASLIALAKNYRHSIFYQLDLKQLVDEFHQFNLPLPDEIPADTPMMIRVHDSMFRAIYMEKQKKISGKQAHVKAGRQDSTVTGEPADRYFEELSFSLLHQSMIQELKDQKLSPELTLQPYQILWGRSPVRLDLAGGWTDTPPYCILFGGKVVNMAVELNGQPPLQVFIRPTEKREIVIRSIDLGVSEIIQSYNELDLLAHVGSAFAIPRAALMLTGFHPGFSSYRFKSLKDQLDSFGGGFDISLMVAVPKGSGLGTSSILAATLLGALSEFCKLRWDRHALAFRTLILEQMLTTGGGWQDQFGGIFEGVKLVESVPGFIQKPSVRWAPDHLFTNPATKGMILLYYTGINRIAKSILRDIVRGMFLNSGSHLSVLSDIKQHAVHTYEAIQNHNWEELTRAIDYSWELNQRLDKGTNTPVISAILKTIGDYMVSCKLLGAGGGGYLMILAKDVHAAGLIRSALQKHSPNPGARFVEWELSQNGFQLSRS